MALSRLHTLSFLGVALSTLHTAIISWRGTVHPPYMRTYNTSPSACSLHTHTDTHTLRVWAAGASTSPTGRAVSDPDPDNVAHHPPLNSFGWVCSIFLRFSEVFSSHWHDSYLLELPKSSSYSSNTCNQSHMRAIIHRFTAEIMGKVEAAEGKFDSKV